MATMVIVMVMTAMEEVCVDFGQSPPGIIT